MLVAASTDCFRQLPLKEALGKLVDLEFTCIELVIREAEGHLMPSQIASNLEQAVRACRETQRLNVVAFNADLDTTDERYYDYFTAICKLAKATKVVSITGGEDGNSEDIYGTVKATLTTFTKTLTSNGLMSMQILDARTYKILREQKYPGEYIWETSWAYYNGDERALSEEQLNITTRKEVDEPTRDEMFAFLSKPIFARVTSDLQTYYKDY